MKGRLFTIKCSILTYLMLKLEELEDFSFKKYLKISWGNKFMIMDIYSKKKNSHIFFEIM